MPKQFGSLAPRSGNPAVKGKQRLAGSCPGRFVEFFFTLLVESVVQNMK